MCDLNVVLEVDFSVLFNKETSRKFLLPYVTFMRVMCLVSRMNAFPIFALFCGPLLSCILILFLPQKESFVINATFLIYLSK